MRAKEAIAIHDSCNPATGLMLILASRVLTVNLDKLRCNPATGLMLILAMWE